MIIQVIIISCQKESYWYKNHIGKLFTVDTEYPSDSNDRYSVVSGRHKGDCIHKNDACSHNQLRKLKLQKLKLQKLNDTN